MINIRKAVSSDIMEMVKLSDLKRRYYEKAQPQFWCRASDANDNQGNYFQDLMFSKDHIVLIAEENKKVIGFIIGNFIDAPSVYQPGGQTLMIDDFCIVASVRWSEIGMLLLKKMKALAKHEGVVQVVIVCGYHDDLKKKFLAQQNLKVVSEWYFQSLVLEDNEPA